MAITSIFASITLIQVLIMLFALFAWSRAILRLRSKSIGLGELLFWSMIWIAVILVALFPEIIANISEIAGVGRAVDLVVYVSIIVLFYLIFRLYIMIDSKNRDMTSLVRELAIRDAKHKNVSISGNVKRNIRNKK